MKIKKIYSYVFASMFVATMGTGMLSCVDLDIPPLNIVTDNEILTSRDGVTAYMARLYSMLPMEDFRYVYNKGFGSGDAPREQPSCWSGEAISRDVTGVRYESFNAWNHAYTLIREANYLMEELPNYASHHDADDIQHWIAEARFVRAYAYFALVKRYGGVPKVDKFIDYPAEATIEDTQFYRDSEESIWDFISSDLDYAIENLPLVSEQKGRANKYVAAAFKSRAMLFAGSIAKYNEVELEYNGARVCGIPATRATDYFKQAYDASLIVDEGGYELYKGEWKDDDKEAQYTNYVNIFLKDTKENIFVRYFLYPDNIHSFGTVGQSVQTSTGGSHSEICPTLDFVEMFDGFDKDANGHFECFDKDGHYKLYNTTMEPFANCEPRLRATVLLPGDEFKGQFIELRRGIYVGDIENGIEPLLAIGTTGFYDDQPQYSDDATSLLKLSKNDVNNNDPSTWITLSDGTQMPRSGKSGMMYNPSTGCGISGFLIRKYMDPKQTNTDWNQSSTNWIELRYAEVLLNRAEAATELVALNAENSTAYKTEAYRCINLIRERAGADLMKSEGDLTIDQVRKERRKELGFENKTYWDLRRWRILDDEQNSKTYRTLQAFMAAEATKYFMDVKLQEQNYLYTYDSRYYYQQIPNDEIQKDPNIKQNPGF